MEHTKKICKICKEEKDLESFSSCKGCKNNKSSRCKTCTNKHMKKYVENNPVYKERRNQRARDFRSDNHELSKLIVKFSCYKKLGLNITKEEYQNMYIQQEGKCKICSNSPTGFKKTLCLDHCHDTLKVRGLLCDNCNAGLGKFKDDIEIIEKAINYLKTNR